MTSSNRCCRWERCWKKRHNNKRSSGLMEKGERKALAQVFLKLLFELISLERHVNRGLEESQRVTAIVSQPFEQS